jgi:hypothetical protein
MTRVYCWIALVTAVAVSGLAAPAVGQTPLLELEKSDGTKVMQVADDGGLVVFGDETGTLPASGAGRRLLWFPGYAAFRAGTAFSDEWDAVYIGYYSTAMGGGATADGFASTAFGWHPRAEADYSTAMGHSTIASGASSTAMGYGTTASGDQSTSMGYHNTASSFSATAMGHLTTASGGASTAMGVRTTAGGHYSTAMGEETTAQAYASLALGRYNAVAGSQVSWVGTDPVLVVGNGTSDANRSNALTLLKNGDLTIAGGLVAGAVYGSSAPGDLATAMGQFATASGDASTAMGGGTTASGTASFAMGSSSTASGTASLAVGSGTTASGTASFAMGSGTTAGGPYSTALGENTIASGWAATAMGRETSASGEFSTAMGNYADTNGKYGAFVYGDDSSTLTVQASADNQYVVRAAGGTYFYSNAGMTAGVRLSAGAGSWSTVSDVNRKENFRSEDGEVVLAKITGTEVTSWNYKAQDPSIRHVGPAAQDFYAAFGLGESDTTITTLDISGINMLAIQALEKRTSDLRTENEQLKARIADLESAILRLETAVSGREH